MRPVRNPWSERTVVRDGVRLVCRDWGGSDRPVLLLHGLAVIVRSLAENAQRSFRSEWEQVACPTLVVLGQSSFVPAREVDDMLRGQRPTTTAMSIPGTGHDLHLEQPGVLHTALVGFLDNLDGLE
ncbi:hypothetical protein ACWEQW_12345 [Streptomyces nigra]